MLGADVILYVGDLLYDDTLRDIGILLARYDSHRQYDDQPDSHVLVWRTWWMHAGLEEYSELGLQNLVALGVFTRYSMVYNDCFDVNKNEKI
jgi:hypothetical protein